MSAVFEGVLISAEKLRRSGCDIDVFPKRSGTRISFRHRELSDGLCVLFRTDDRNAPFSEEMETLATELSAETGNALVVRYDSRVGHHSSVYFENGELVASFDNDDEIFAMVNEDESLSDERYTGRQLLEDSDIEYEVIQNAIELGLEKLGVGEWKGLLSLIYNQ